MTSQPGIEEENVASTDPISKATIDAGRAHVFYKNKRGERFNITALQRMNIHYMRKRILDETMVILKDGEMHDGNSERLTSLIQNYCAAIRDREFMMEVAYRDWDNNLFHLKSQRPMERDLLCYLKANGVQPEEMVDSDEDNLPGGPWDFPSASRIRRELYTLAVLGGVILIGPMILMVLLPTTSTSLATAGICTMLFAVAAAYFSPTKLPLELLAATATYAAVLVVFVGGSISNCGCS